MRSHADGDVFRGARYTRALSRVVGINCGLSPNKLSPTLDARSLYSQCSVIPILERGLYGRHKAAQRLARNGPVTWSRAGLRTL